MGTVVVVRLLRSNYISTMFLLDQQIITSRQAILMPDFQVELR